MGRIPINYGTTPGDNTGDPLFTSFESIEANFKELYEQLDVGEMYISSELETVINTMDVWEKVAGTTLQINDIGFDDGGANNRLRYLGFIPEKKEIIATISFVSAANNKNFQFAFYQYDDSGASGAIATHTIQQRKSGASVDIGSITITALVDIDTNDYIEVHCRNIDDNTNMTAKFMTVVIK